MLLLPERWLKCGGRCILGPLFLAFVGTDGCKVVGAMLANSREANFLCDWPRQILQAWPVNDGSVKDEKAVFVFVNADGVLFTAITRGDLDLRYVVLWWVMHVGEDDDSGLKKFAVDIFYLREVTGFRPGGMSPDDARFTKRF